MQVADRPTSTSRLPVEERFSPTFMAFYQAEYLGAVRLAALLSGSAADSEDITADAFLAMADRFERIETPNSYLRTAIVNGVRRRHRNLARRAERLRLLLPPPPDRADDHGLAELIDVIRALPFRQRTAIVGRYWAGWTETEIAAVLGCRPGTVKSLTSRALTTLRTSIGDATR